MAKDEEKAPVEEETAWEGSLSSSQPLEGPDGHPILTKEDIKERD
jgi:hypothetical protein